MWFVALPNPRAELHDVLPVVFITVHSLRPEWLDKLTIDLAKTLARSIGIDQDFANLRLPSSVNGRR